MPAGLLLALALFAQATASSDDQWKNCRDPDADARIKGCTALIQAAQDPPRELAVAYYNRANAHRAKQLLDLALQDYNEAIKLNSKFVDALGDRGATLIALGRFAEAIPDFSQVLDLDPKTTYALYDRGLAYELLGLDDLALEDFSAAITLEPRDAHRFERRGTVYFRKGEYDKALADYEKALEFDPQYAPALYGRGIIKRMRSPRRASGERGEDTR